MAANFPDSPSTNDTFTSNGLTFTWNGSAWKLDPSSGTKGDKGQKGEVGVTGDKGQEQGKEISLSMLRGSHSIAQISDAVIALERDQQAEDPVVANTTTVRVLKNRYAGETGVATYLLYNKDSGRLKEIENPLESNNQNDIEDFL